MTARERKDRRRWDAWARQGEYDALTVKQRIRRAESRRGNSARELARLRALLDGGAS